MANLLTTVTDGAGPLQWVHQMYDYISQAVNTLLQTIAAYTLQIQHSLVQVTGQVGTSLSSPNLWHPLIYWSLVIVMLVGVVGAFVPALPGITLILAAVVIWGLVNGFTGLAWALGVAIAALLLSLAIDYLAGIIGAQRVGASRWGQIGAFVGMLLGIFGLLPALPTGIPLLGLLLGTIVGAFLGEFLHRRDLPLWLRTQQSAKVGLAIIVGTLVGNVLQGILAFISVVVFIVTTLPGL
jgi:uncharacterized protein YqgC (DUF456 family)